MKYVIKTIFVALLLSVFIMPLLEPQATTYASDTNDNWDKTFGGTESDGGKAVVQTSDGGYLIAGSTRSFVSNGQNITDGWLIRTDADGIEQWSKTYDNQSTDSFISLQITSDGGYIIAGVTGTLREGNDLDFWLVKMDSDGNQQWSKTFGGVERDVAQSVVQTSDGGYAIVGFTLSFGHGLTDEYGRGDVWLIKTDSSGNEQWNKTFGEEAQDSGSSIILASDNGYLITGHKGSISNGGGDGETDLWLIKTDTSGNKQWEKTFGGEDDDGGFAVVQTSDDGYAIAGYTHSSGNGHADVWLIKTDSSGNELWDKTFGGAKEEWAQSIALTSDGGYILTGFTFSFGFDDRDCWLIKTDSSGSEEWNKTFGGIGEDQGSSVIQTTNGSYVITGQTEPDGEGDYDVWLIKTDDSIPPPRDTDNDGLPDADELILGANPLVADTDGDGLSDAVEIRVYGTDPLVADTDSDGVSDGLEAIATGLTADIEALAEGWIRVNLLWSDYTMEVETSSTVLGVTFNSDTKQLSITVSGNDGTTGECTIVVPKALVSASSDISINFDDEPIEFTVTEDGDYYNISVEYNHSTHTLVANLESSPTGPDEPESPNGSSCCASAVAASTEKLASGWTLLGLLGFATVYIHKRQRRKQLVEKLMN